MSSLFKGCSSVLPIAPTRRIDVSAVFSLDNPSFISKTVAANGALTVTLESAIVTEWIDVYVDGVGIVNKQLGLRTDGFGYKYDSYNLYGKNLIFAKPVVGEVEIICHTKPSEDQFKFIDLRDNRLQIDNILYAATDCTLHVLTRPAHGWVKVASSRLGFDYTAKRGYRGIDSFSFKLVGRNGQESEPKCCYINVV